MVVNFINEYGYTNQFVEEYWQIGKSPVCLYTSVLLSALHLRIKKSLTLFLINVITCYLCFLYSNYVKVLASQTSSGKKRKEYSSTKEINILLKYDSFRKQTWDSHDVTKNITFLFWVNLLSMKDTRLMILKIKLLYSLTCVL